MGFRVTLQPSGHQFSAEPQETLLEAALRSGVNVNYNCSSGSCGDCKARVISGQSEDRHFHDYRLSESERANGVILLCTQHAQSDLIIEAQEAHGAADIPHQTITTKVAKLEQLNDSIYTLLLRTPRTQTLRFLAGQHVELLSAGLIIDLPIASCPCNGMMLQFHLRRGQDEPFISQLIAQGQSGATVAIDGPFGEFALDDGSQRAMVMIAEDTGFAPIKGLIEHAVNLEKAQPLYLYRIASDPDGLYMGNYCEAWRDALDNYAYTPLLAADDEARRGALARIAGEMAAPSRTDLYLAVSPPLLEVALPLFLAAGVPSERLFVHQQRGQARPVQQAEAH